MSGCKEHFCNLAGGCSPPLGRIPKTWQNAARAVSEPCLASFRDPAMKHLQEGLHAFVVAYHTSVAPLSTGKWWKSLNGWRNCTTTQGRSYLLHISGFRIAPDLARVGFEACPDVANLLATAACTSLRTEGPARKSGCCGKTGDRRNASNAMPAITTHASAIFSAAHTLRSAWLAPKTRSSPKLAMLLPMQRFAHASTAHHRCKRAQMRANQL